MSAQQKIAALEGLLARIEANRALPRLPYVASPAVPAAAVLEEAPAPAAYVPSAVEAAPEEIEAEDVELFDDEIVEVTVDSAPPADAAPQATETADFELRFSDPADALSEPSPSEPEANSTETDFSDVSTALEPAAAGDTQAAVPGAPADARDTFEEEAPASSKRAKVTPTSMSEALAEAASHAEREVPLKTPPPESGPQAASPVQIPAAGRLPSLPPEPAEEQAEVAQAPAEPVNAAAAFAALEPEVAARAAAEANVLRIVGAATAFKPKSFLELLDATLGLSRGE